MPGNESVIRAYRFLRGRATDQNAFSKTEMANATGWKIKSVDTYISKQWKGYLSHTGRGEEKLFKVKREFLRVNIDEFLGVFTQKRLVVPEYQRAKHEVVLQFEFLLPLSKEEQLRRALDELFYADTLRSRIHEIGLRELENIVDRAADLEDRAYVTHVLGTVSDYFGGYSISHVEGRFRAAALTDLATAARKMKDRERYLIDETTAVVRFIAPCYTTKTEFDDDIVSIVRALKQNETVDQDALLKEIGLIRSIFFFFFVETVIRTVKGEDEIWLLETGPTRRLYRWTKQ